MLEKFFYVNTEIVKTVVCILGNLKGVFDNEEKICIGEDVE